jgi:hypothetical protein
MRTLRRGSILLVLMFGVVLACDSWAIWDNVFVRSSVGSSRGWTGGDGALSAQLPGGRLFWIFGDSWVTSHVANQRPQLATVAGQLANGAWGNTIAVQTDIANPSASGIDFYGRDPNLHFPENINTGIGSAVGVGKFFTRLFLLGSTLANDTPLYWPNGAECVSCTGANARLLLGFTRWQLGCDPNPPGQPKVLNCYPVCSLEGAPDDATCHKGFAMLSSVVARIKGVDQAPMRVLFGHFLDNWSVDGGSVEMQHASNLEPVMWGTAFHAAGSETWIFGNKVRTASNPATTDLVVAKATNVLDRSTWRYWNGSSWVVSSGTLASIATKVGFLNSVDSITRAGTTRFLLVHGAPLEHLTYVRVSEPLSGANPPRWLDSSATTPRIDLTTIDSSLAAEQSNLLQKGACVPNSAVAPSNAQHCGTVYHSLAHAHLASNDASGPLFVPVSYVVPKGPNPLFDPSKPPSESNPHSSSLDASYYRPKFTAVQIDKLRPWCNSTTDCWEGIVKDSPSRPLTSSSESMSYNITSSARFYVHMLRVSGAPTLRVDYKRLLNGVLVSVAGGGECGAVAGTSGLFACNHAKPSGATQASVTVSGQVGNAYALRVHHAGFY